SKILPFLIENYGRDISQCPTKIKNNTCMHDPNGALNRCYPLGEKSLRVDMDGKDFSERGFKVEVNRELKRIIIHFDHIKVAPVHKEWLKGIKQQVGLGDLDQSCHWTFESIEKKWSRKLKNMRYMSIDEKEENEKQFLKIDECNFLETFNFERFLSAIELGYVQIEFSTRTHHNHGTAFRTWERYWSYFYDVIESL
ncbi:MAG: MvaI/BcnI family restriction endonuclease, partial [Nitrososphaerales archaeon]